MMTMMMIMAVVAVVAVVAAVPASPLTCPAVVQSTGVVRTRSARLVRLAR
jgi:hypothetical protein